MEKRKVDFCHATSNRIRVPFIMVCGKTHRPRPRPHPHPLRETSANQDRSYHHSLTSLHSQGVQQKLRRLLTANLLALLELKPAFLLCPQGQGAQLLPSWDYGLGAVWGLLDLRGPIPGRKGSAGRRCRLPLSAGLVAFTCRSCRDPPCLPHGGHAAASASAIAIAAPLATRGRSRAVSAAHIGATQRRKRSNPSQGRSVELEMRHRPLSESRSSSHSRFA